MRKLFLVAGFLTGFLALAGCDHYDDDKAAVTKEITDDADQVATNEETKDLNAASKVRDQVKVTADKLRTWLIAPPPAKGAPHAIASSYCYRSLQDVLCYRQPIPGWEQRLVAYQGTNAAPPPPAMMATLPKRVIDESVLPENKVANSKPVFTTVPPPPKEEEKNSDSMPILDATHEQLPNPSLLPQL